MLIIDANEVPVTLPCCDTFFDFTWHIPQSPIYRVWAERHITNIDDSGLGLGEISDATLCIPPCVAFAARGPGSYIQRSMFADSALDYFRSMRNGLALLIYNIHLEPPPPGSPPPPAPSQRVDHMYLIIENELERSHDIHLYTQLDRMFAECRVAHKTISSEASGITSFPIAYQVVEEVRPDFVFLAPGRAFDGETPLNHAIGVKIYRGQFASPGWTFSNVLTSPPAPLWYTSIFDTQMLIPWGRERLYLYILFEKTSTVVTSAKISFSIVPYSEIK